MPIEGSGGDSLSCSREVLLLVTAACLQGLPNPEKVSAEVQQMWVLTEMIHANRAAARIGRFDVSSQLAQFTAQGLAPVFDSGLPACLGKHQEYLCTLKAGSSCIYFEVLSVSISQ